MIEHGCHGEQLPRLQELHQGAMLLPNNALGKLFDLILFGPLPWAACLSSVHQMILKARPIKVIGVRSAAMEPQEGCGLANALRKVAGYAW